MSLEAHDISVSFGNKQILKTINARFHPGSVTAIVGPNGAGKSTLLSCLSGLRKPFSGQALLDGLPIFSMPARQRAQKIGFIPQNPEVAWDIDVLTLIRLGRTPYGGFNILDNQGKIAVERAIKKTATEPLAERDVTTLSGGERTRVILARALAGEPQWLLADEPFTGLDPRHQLEAAQIFKDMAKQDGKGVIITLHDLSLAARMADTIMVIADGEIAEMGPPLTALAPGILSSAYGVRTRFIDGESGPLIEVMGRCTV